MKTNDIIIAEKYMLGTMIGSGSFGQVYNGYNIITKKEVAIKLVKL